MSLLNATIHPSAKQIAESQLVVKSTRYWKMEARLAGNMVFIKDDYGNYQGNHGKINPAELKLLKELGFEVSVGIPNNMKVVDEVFYILDREITDWIKALVSFDEYYRYSDSASVYRNHSENERIINSRKPTLFEAWYCMMKVDSSKLKYIPKELQEEVKAMTHCDYWKPYADTSCRPEDELIGELSANYQYLIKPCRFED